MKPLATNPKSESTPAHPQPSAQGMPARNNRLDIHRIGDFYIGIFREPFDRVSSLTGFRLRPVNDDLTIWSFEDPETGKEGRLLDVPGFLQEDHVVMTGSGMTYMMRDRSRLLALHLPANPRRLKLTEANFKVVQPKEGVPLYPESWPNGLAIRVIRSWLYRVVIVDEKYLLSRLTLN
ncbi:MAG: hypothetical protein V3T00_01635 [bacterium]